VVLDNKRTESYLQWKNKKKLNSGGVHFDEG